MGPFLHTSGLGLFQIPPPICFVCEELTPDINAASRNSYLKLRD